ncbi:MAG: amidohydrolase family protein, partial [Oscillospiraceae bacterium]|nr:amidohydrolase family protein [Oscillospiraceae bacterium]
TYELMLNLGKLQVKYKLPVQSHLAENLSELEWVQELYPECASYAQAYNQFGLFGSEDGVSVPTIMAHCVWCDESMVNLIKDNNVYVAHCPQSNINLSSGIAPIRHFIDKEINIGLGTDVAAGASLSIFRAISDAVQASNLYWRLIDDNGKPLSIYEAFYLATAGGGSFFGKVGKFENEYEFDAIIIDDRDAKSAYPLTISERLTRVIYNTADYKIVDKYVRGENVWNV